MEGGRETQLLDAAEECFWRFGDLGLTVRRITAISETSTQSIYYHFGSRDALITAMVKRAVNHTSTFLGSLDRHDSDLPSRAVAYATYCAHHPARMKLIAEPPPTGTGYDTELQLLRKRIVQFLDYRGALVAAIHGLIAANLHQTLTTTPNVLAEVEALTS